MTLVTSRYQSYSLMLISYLSDDKTDFSSADLIKQILILLA